MINKLLSAFLIVVSLFNVASCGGVSDDEILSTLSELAPRAAEVYAVIYGDSVPHGEADESGMCMVSEDSKYKSTADISLSMLDAFTVEYADVLANTAFRGVTSDEGGKNPKFFEQDGVLYVCPSATEGFVVPSAPDLTNAKVVKKNKFMAVVNIPQGDGIEDDIEVTLRFTDKGWKIDSPLF